MAWAVRDVIAVAGGCLCGGLRYAATGDPILSGYCCCDDCRRASGSGFIPFMVYPAAGLTVTGVARRFTSPSARGSDAVRNFCPTCGSLVHGGTLGEDPYHTLYAGTLDDGSRFVPTVAIFTRDRPGWVVLPPGLSLFPGMPAS